jgi:hypothetical protein
MRVKPELPSAVKTAAGPSSQGWRNRRIIGSMMLE